MLRFWIRAALLATVVLPGAASAQGFGQQGFGQQGFGQPGSGQYRGTPQDQQACEPDVSRLCGQFIPDVDRIVGCLKARRAQLSPACRAVMTPKGRR
ncbi:MAG: hypothetical protein NVSMB26_17390 [Beijerinckiaceae bacterium]